MYFGKIGANTHCSGRLCTRRVHGDFLLSLIAALHLSSDYGGGVDDDEETKLQSKTKYKTTAASTNRHTDEIHSEWNRIDCRYVCKIIRDGSHYNGRRHCLSLILRQRQLAAAPIPLALAIQIIEIGKFSSPQIKRDRVVSSPRQPAISGIFSPRRSPAALLFSRQQTTRAKRESRNVNEDGFIDSVREHVSRVRRRQLFCASTERDGRETTN
jgi:hypothetical protein